MKYQDGEEIEADPDASSPDINQGRWLSDEHAMFLHGLMAHGREWNKIAELVKSRTVVQIRTHAQKYFQKVAKTTGGPVMSTSKKGDVVRSFEKTHTKLTHQFSNHTLGTERTEFRKRDHRDNDLNTVDPRTETFEKSPEQDYNEHHQRDESIQRSPGRKKHDSVFSNKSDIVDSATEDTTPSSRPCEVFSDIHGKKRIRRREIPDATSTKKFKNIRVPGLPKADDNGVSLLLSSSRQTECIDDGGVTPRTVAAATILVKPIIQHKLLTGGDTPKTRQQAYWLQSHGAQASMVLGMRPLSGQIPTTSSYMSWETATENHQNG